jgi:type II secretory pathway pseudopilin PulG
MTVTPRARPSGKRPRPNQTRARPRGRLSRLAETMRRDDRGVALVMVIGVSSVLALLLVAAVTVALGGLRSARGDESYSAALAAAYAGVEEYQSRLAADPTYTRFGNPAAPYSSGTAAPAVSAPLTVPTGASSNPAFGIGTTGTWATVAGSGGTASYRYEVNTAKLDTNGTVSLRSTGRVGTETRTVVAELRVNSFLDYLYFTDFEVEDPAQYGASATGGCATYAYAGRGSGCHEIAFMEGDVLDGPVHSNDRFRSCEATFRGAVTTATVTPPLYSKMDSNGLACGASTFDDPASPRTAGMVVMPATNTELKLETRTDLADPAGCLFTGPTQITLNRDGTLTVRSPWTKKTQISGSSGTTGSSPAGCGVPGSGVGGLASAAGSTFAVPDHNVVYVQAVPAVRTDANYWASDAVPRVPDASGRLRDLACVGAGGQDHGNGIGYPTTNEVVADDSVYGCRAGDAFVSGTLRGALTIASANTLYITGDVTYQNANRDVLGLVGDGAILVWNPLDAAKGSLLSTKNRTISAALLSVAHTFQVQNHDLGGDRGTLTVVGAIAQKFRGIVRSGSNGYLKDYNYDTRFRYLTPPKFLLPVSTTYDVTSWTETSRAFSANGAAQ